MPFGVSAFARGAHGRLWCSGPLSGLSGRSDRQIGVAFCLADSARKLPFANVCSCNGPLRVNPLSVVFSPEACFCPQSIGVAARWCWLRIRRPIFRAQSPKGAAADIAA